ncbi:MAG: chemotaxis protein CheW [Planctomycetales bacterium]|nr:chemotaxis protein CheW [Planctomycetales bacterium]
MILVARCGDFSVGFPLASVREVIAGPVLGPPDPRCPGLRGSVTHRGAKVPVVDLRERLGCRAAEPPTPPRRAVVLGLVPGRVALAVDAVVGLTEGTLATPPGGRRALPGLPPVALASGEVVTVLDPLALFRPGERAALAESARAGARGGRA